ncbi:hypothetical protein BC629DRAFT_1582279 [Irpex lacteus]|nr:hypothetical protein BC629DRAFT_1582279 [Irpex lacteus]
MRRTSLTFVCSCLPLHALSDSVGGYEVRLKDWNETLQRSRNSTRNEWESRTVYIEGIPLQHRAIVGIYHLVSGLLPVDTTRLRVQSISLPKHHLDKPGDKPKCKGFALVTLLLDSDVELLLQRWPWKRQRPIEKEDSNPLVHEAIKYGLRTLSKSRWDALNSEYLQHRQRILESIAQQERLNAPPPDTEEDEEEKPSGPLSLDLSAPYPPGCLIHSRHVHPETNKTTLRKLFSKASPDGNDGIDYVDFTKGTDTCYLRLATPKYTTQLVAHFSDNPVVQTTGLDDTVVDGTREELYWLKVPEKIRRQAVEKAVLVVRTMERWEGAGDGGA